MTRRCGTGFILFLCVSWLILSSGAPVLAQMGPGMMRERGRMGQGQGSVMPIQQMTEVIKQMASRLASREGFDAERAERLRHLADQLVAATGRMTGGMGGGMMGGGMMGGDMMGQGSEEMREISRMLSQMSDLLRDQ